MLMFCVAGQKFAYFATIPVFVLQLSVLALVLRETIVARRRRGLGKTAEISDDARGKGMVFDGSQEGDLDMDTVLRGPKYEVRVESTAVTDGR